MHRLIVVGAAVALLASACQAGAPDGGTPAGTTTGTSAVASPSPTTTPVTSTPSPLPSVSYEVWFGASGGTLFVTRRTGPSTPRIGTAALEALLAGPSAAERAAGIVTSIPAETKLLSLAIGQGIATANLSRAFESGGGSLSMFSRLAQVTFTLTQFPTVRGVNLELDGRPVRVFSAEGIVLDRPMTRRSFRDLLPPILVKSPLIGQRVSSPITVAGSANVFEATVSIAILDAQGRKIAATFTQATCGTGCRGTYSKAVRYTIARTQPGTVKVFESSAATGRPIKVVEIPVILTA